MGTTAFKDNTAGQGGGIFVRLEWYDPSVTDYEVPTLTFPADPDDLIFEGNFANVSSTAIKVLGDRLGTVTSVFDDRNMLRFITRIF